MIRFIGKRLMITPVQALGVTIVTFFLVRLLPGNPALLLTGPFATQETVDAMQERLGLNAPVWTQYWLYVKNIATADLGSSVYTGRPVRDDIVDRLPATLELITLSLIVILILGVGLGTLVALRPRGVADRMSSVYGLFAGSFPDFWLGLIFVYVFFFKLGWLPAPLGRIDPDLAEPRKITGFLTVDSLIAGNFRAFVSAVEHLALPVATLVAVYMGPILKLTRARLHDTLDADFVEYARAIGFSNRARLRYALRSALPPVVTMTGVTYSFLLGGAVLVETIFSWGGLGQYSVQAVTNSDYLSIQGVILTAALFNIFVFLVVDIIDRVIDPRLEVASE